MMTSKKMEDDLQKKWKTTSNKMEDDLNKNGRQPKKINGRRPIFFEDDLKKEEETKWKTN